MGTKAYRAYPQVLTCNRETNLRRLLASLVNAEYDGDLVDLDIVIDHCQPQERRIECIDVAVNFVWPHGEKRLRVR